MKRWAILTVGLYGLALVALTPLFWGGCFAWGEGGWYQQWNEVAELYAAWGYWVWVGVAVVGQFLLLLVPVRAAAARPVPRRPLRVSIFTAAFLCGVMAVLLVTNLATAIWSDDGLTMYTLFGDRFAWAVLAGYVVIAWSAWGIVFLRRYRQTDPQAALRRLTTWLLRGSILELLVAVPTHVLVRHRQDCCAPFGTAAGIAAGLTVMLMSFGPGALLLFADRWRRRQARS